MQGRMIIWRFVLVLVASLAAGVVFAVDAPYDDSAFPLAERPAEARRIASELNAVIKSAVKTDRIVDAAFAGIPDDDLLRIRLTKRRELRSRTVAFARKYLKRGDATGLGFAEQAVADLELFDKIFREEAANIAVSPRPENNPVVIHLADFGAKGDGKTDNALAFERAFAAIRAFVTFDTTLSAFSPTLL